MATKRQGRRKAASRAATRAREREAPASLAVQDPPVDAPPSRVARESARARIQRLADHPRFPLAALAGIYLVAVAIHAWVASRHLFPNVFPDEMLYGKMSQSFAAGDGIEWRGTNWGVPPLWSIVLSPVWHVGSVPDGYALGRVLTPALASAVVVPTWLLARTVVSARLALVAAALTVAGSWMAVTSYLVTENLAFPLAAASLAATVMAIRTTRLRWLVISLGFAAAATLCRTQMLALPVILLVALALDVVRQPRGSRIARLRAWPRLLWAGMSVGVVAMCVAFVANPHLTNYDFLAFGVGIGEVIETIVRHASGSVVAFGFVPVAAALGLMTRRAHWRDPAIGPLLVTLAASLVVLLPLLGRFEATATQGNPVERYTMYLAPLLCIALVAAAARLDRRSAAFGALAAFAVLLLVPQAYNAIEQPGLFGLQQRLHLLGDFFSDNVRVVTVVVGAALLAGGGLALSARRRERGLAVAVALTAAVALVQGWTYQDYEVSNEHEVRGQIAPPQADWVDRAASGDVGILAFAKPQPMSQNVDLYTDFFNRRIKTLYTSIPTVGEECFIEVTPAGALRQASGACRPWPRELVVVEGPVHASIRGERVVTATTGSGRLVSIPPGDPQLNGLVKPPCTADGCDGILRVGLYLTEKAKLTLAFGPSAIDHSVQTAEKVHVLEAGRPGVIELDVPRGNQTINLPVDWTSTDGPPLRRVVVETGAGSTRIY